MIYKPFTPHKFHVAETKSTPKKTEVFKPKKCGEKTTHVVFILDSSSSMSYNKDATISGYNEYLATQKAEAKESGIETVISLYTFNGSGVKCVLDRVSSEEVKDLTTEDYNPNGMTNLFDAIGNVMFNVNHDLKRSKKENRDNIVITILTDGQENASKEFTNSDIKTMVEMAESKNWAFLFLGANINAFALGSTFGMRNENTIQYTMNNISDAVALASVATNKMKSGVRSGHSTVASYASAFNDADRAKVVKND